MAEIESGTSRTRSSGRLELSDEVFKAELNEPLIWEAVKHYAGLASGRNGGDQDARRGQRKREEAVATEGHGASAHRQHPQPAVAARRHGARPAAEGLRLSFPRKKLRGAMRSALSAKLGENLVTVVDSFSLESHKTADFRKVLKGLCGSGKVLIVESAANRNLELSSRNLPDVKLVPGNAVNIRDVVNCRMLLFSKDAILQVQEVLSR